jgi:hypothetical protein
MPQHVERTVKVYELAQDILQWRALVKMVMNFRIPINIRDIHE